MKGQNKLFIAIIIALLLGVGIGGIVHVSYPDSAEPFSKNIKLLGTVFIRLVQMIIAPLVFTTLVVGIAKMSDIKMIGRVGTKAMLWFISASLISLFIGLILVNWLEPGHVTKLPIQDVASADELLKSSKSFSMEDFVKHMIPKSLFEAFATNEVLQIVVFAVMFGVALANLGEEYAKPVVKLFDIIAHAILKMVGYIMWFAPLGVLGAIAAVVATNGFEIFKVYAIYLRDFFFAIGVLWLVLLLVGYFILGNRLFDLLKRIKEPLLIAFSTTSSEAVFPKLVEELEKFGCNSRVVSFILPLGYSFNLDGSMMYMTFASIFIAQIYGIEMTLGQQITMLLVLMLTSKGIAGVPRASLVIIVATCSMFGIPPEGIALILPIDHFCDMGRSMTNVLGNTLATTAVSKWEGQLTEPLDKI
ncbi:MULTISPECIES: dicarboxylate/amino acid:cation symporter [Chryseobacterium]|jgi:Na+/H+-dicarboxylate symporter|uniref:Cation:dicarboxylase symporter family transporter n=6 Tax=Chryseobacterium TaxID=59732 RepID=A0A411DJG8_CHRID|nr:MULTISPECIES: cation:dicarboxylase symporter family transporter [Chryseobacterium]KYH05534.1 C4-dicarboxylate ABC transporter [Chryseobacterium cucumeris]MCC3216349.1 cation:dicarboxylase symporter family transporter [Chryseobacterium sp. X308]MDH5032088.1 cation:dicarboxylase symporter family transporter [Chryseobacterium cucumeris]MDQ1855251.1 cation:dicarboxylase symporter family transporter [Chryseobacterium sp. WLY505]MDR4952443.1 cation:dicarboxylase symporter family transporter [Chry